jgi:hypothetical protein
MQLDALAHVAVPPHDDEPLHWIAHVAACAQSALVPQLLSLAHTNRHATPGGHEQLAPQLILHSFCTHDPPGHVAAEHATTATSGIASASPPASIAPSERGEKCTRPHATSTTKTASRTIGDAIAFAR